MAKRLVLGLAVLLAVAATASAASRDRDHDHDGLRDSWERRYQMSTRVNSAARDPDRDGLTNRREYRLKTHPRRADTDRDGLRDGVEVRRYHTDPRKKDTDGDGARDAAEIRAKTNPRDARSRPAPSTVAPPPAGTAPAQTPAPLTGFPSPATTGVPAGWTPAQTRADDLIITVPGTVVQDVRFTDGASIDVRADDVTIRRVEMQGGAISNQFGTPPANCGHNLIVEDVTFLPPPGPFTPSDYPVIGEGSYTARRIKAIERGEGPRLSDCGSVTLEDSFIQIRGGESSSRCGDTHSDGVQAVAGVGATARNNTIIFMNDCGTSPWFVVNPSVNRGRYVIDRLLVSGGGYTFRQQVPASVTGLRVVDRAWLYGPLGEMDCSVISPWDAKLVNIDANYQVSKVVRDLPCTE